MALRFEDDFLKKLEYLHVVSKRAFAGQSRADRLARKRGRGLEFADHRGYTPGDDFRQIDWKAYKRLGRLLLRLFDEEQDLPIYLFIDSSQSMREAGQVRSGAAHRRGTLLHRPRASRSRHDAAVRQGRSGRKCSPAVARAAFSASSKCSRRWKPPVATDLRDTFVQFAQPPAPAGSRGRDFRLPRSGWIRIRAEDAGVDGTRHLRRARRVRARSRSGRDGRRAVRGRRNRRRPDVDVTPALSQRLRRGMARHMPRSSSASAAATTSATCAPMPKSPFDANHPEDLPEGPVPRMSFGAMAGVAGAGAHRASPAAALAALPHEGAAAARAGADAAAVAPACSIRRAR